MNDLVYISRNFTEFGGFAPAEIVDFQKRGILCESDFVRMHGSEAWQPLTEWLTSAVSETPAPKAAKPKAAAKKKTAKNGVKKEKAAA
jgi:LysM repeat protein